MADRGGAPTLAVIGGQPGLTADVVAKTLADAGIDVRLASEALPDRADAIVLVEPRPADWRVVESIDAAVVVFTMSPDASTLARALRHGARAIIDGAADVDAVVRAVEVVGEGSVVLTTAQVKVLIDAIERDVPAVDDDAPRLSPRETQILASIARGESIKQTALALGISEKTVEHLQSRLHLKLGARSRAQAVTRAHALGLLPDDPTAG